MPLVTLVAVIKGDAFDNPEHLGLASLAASLKASGCEVHTLATTDAPASLAIKILKTQPQIVGFTTYAANIRLVLETCQALKRKFPTIVTVLGGPTASSCPQEILTEQPAVDLIVKGEGEVTLVEAVARLKSDASTSGIKGLWARQGISVVSDGECPLIKNLDSLPVPVRGCWGQERIGYFVVESARGCLGNCTFCNSTFPFQPGARWRGRSPASVVDEIESLVARYGVRHFNIVDLSFEDPGSLGQRRMKEIALEILNRNLDISFMVQFRAETVRDSVVPVLQSLKKAGLERVSLGLETGDPESLRLFGKKATTEDNYRIVRIINELGLSMYHGFIMFHPYSSFAGLRRNLHFLSEVGMAGRIEHFVTRLMVFPGTAIAERLVKDGLMASVRYDSDPTDYQYVDERVAILGKAMSELNNQQDLKTGVFDLATDSFVRVIKRLTVQKRVDLPELAEFKCMLRRRRTQLARAYQRFFSDSLGLAENCWQQCTFDRWCKEICLLVEAHIGDIRSQQLALGLKAIRKGLDPREIEGCVHSASVARGTP